LQWESANGGKHPFVVGKDSAQMLALLLGEPVAVFANDVAELGLHLLTLIGRKLEGGACLSAKIAAGCQSGSGRKNSSRGDGCLLTKFTPGDALAASVVGRLGHGQAWSCMLYPRVNRNLALLR
jgi:hypothetical protein